LEIYPLRFCRELPWRIVSSEALPYKIAQRMTSGELLAAARLALPELGAGEVLHCRSLVHKKLPVLQKAAEGAF
jgi:hypothetical protein